MDITWTPNRSIPRRIEELILQAADNLSIPTTDRSTVHRILVDIEAALPKRAGPDVYEPAPATSYLIDCLCPYEAKPTVTTANDDKQPVPVVRYASISDDKQPSTTMNNNNNGGVRRVIHDYLTGILGILLDEKPTSEESEQRTCRLLNAIARIVAAEFGSGRNDDGRWLAAVGRLLDYSSSVFYRSTPFAKPTTIVACTTAANLYADARLLHTDDIDSLDRLYRWRQNLAVGQAVDASPTGTGRWLPAVIRGISERSFLVHFVGRPDRDDAWIDRHSIVFPPSVVDKSTVDDTNRTCRHSSVWMLSPDEKSTELPHPKPIAYGRICPAGEFRRHLSAGDLVDVMETDHIWYAGRVIQRLTPAAAVDRCNTRDLRINFITWPSGNDIILNLYSTRIRRHGVGAPIYGCRPQNMIMDDTEIGFTMPRSISAVPLHTMRPNWPFLDDAIDDETTESTTEIPDWFTGAGIWYSERRLITDPAVAVNLGGGPYFNPKPVPKTQKPMPIVEPTIVCPISRQTATVIGSFVEAGGIGNLLRYLSTTTDFATLLKTVEPICAASRCFSRPFAVDATPLFLRGISAHAIRIAGMPESDFSVRLLRRLLENLRSMSRHADPIDGRSVVSINRCGVPPVTSETLDRGAGGGTGYPILLRCGILSLLAYYRIGAADVGSVILSYAYSAPWSAVETVWTCPSCTMTNAEADAGRCVTCSTLAPRYFERRGIVPQPVVSMPNVGIYVVYDAYAEYKHGVSTVVPAIRRLRNANIKPTTTWHPDYAVLAWKFVVSWMDIFENTADDIQTNDLVEFGYAVWTCFPPDVLRFIAGVLSIRVEGEDAPNDDATDLKRRRPQIPYLLAAADRLPPPSPPPDWTCGVCTFINSGADRSTACQICGSYASSSSSSSSSAAVDLPALEDEPSVMQEID